MPEDEEYEEYIEEYASVSSIVKQSLPLLLLYTLGGVAAGTILSGMTDKLALIPGLLVLVPAVLGMRGNISCALGSRLGSAMHMGLITKIERNPELSSNISASISLSLMISLVLGMLGHYTVILLGHESAGILVLTSIAVIAGVISGVILCTITVFFALAMFQFGIDPDNVVSPAIATIGDIVSILCLLLAATVVIS